MSEKVLFDFLGENYQHVAGKNKFSNHPKRLYEEINIPQSTANLFTTVDALENLNIKHSVVFGTLLGIYRDGELIKHDTDSDLAIWLQDPNKIIELVKNLEDKQLILTRFDYRMITFTRGGDYIDIYMYRSDKNDSNILNCVHVFGTLSPIDFDGANTVTFHNRKINCVHNPEEYFQNLYGADWKTPIKGKHANIRYGQTILE